MYAEESDELSESVKKKKTTIKRLQKKFNEVEIYVQRECQKIPKYKKMFIDYEIVPFLTDNEDLLSKKNELREKAVEYINEFEEKRRAAIELRKKENIKNEEYFLSNKKLEKEGKKNAWEIVTDNITLKESEYKGTKDVSRMRNVIVARKNDNVNSTSQPGF